MFGLLGFAQHWSFIAPIYINQPQSPIFPGPAGESHRTTIRGEHGIDALGQASQAAAIRVDDHNVAAAGGLEDESAWTGCAGLEAGRRPLTCRSLRRCWCQGW